MVYKSDVPLFEFTEAAITELKRTSFESFGVQERSDLQRLLRESISVIDPDIYVITEEFGDWQDAKRRIDLLCLDRDANLVVVELKRTEDGGHMDLQALRYAAMVSTLTFEKLVESHVHYLTKCGRGQDATQCILQFLGWEEEVEHTLGDDVRIILVAAEFSKEITSTVLWLNERDLDIRCIRLRPYEWESRLLLDVQQIIPLPEASDYQVKVKEKAVEKRAAERKFNPDFSKYDLTVGEEAYPHLTKRALGFRVLQAAIRAGVTPQELTTYIGGAVTSWLITADGILNAEEFAQAASQISTKFGKYQLSRFFVRQEDLIHIGGKTCAISNQWDLGDIPALQRITEGYPDLKIQFVKADA
jgi:hypothetical protein